MENIESHQESNHEWSWIAGWSWMELNKVEETNINFEDSWQKGKPVTGVFCVEFEGEFLELGKT